MLFSLTLFAQSDNENGTLVIYREPLYQGSKFSYPVEVNGVKVVSIKSGTFYVKSLPVGKYRISAKTEIESFTEVTINPFDTAFVRCGVLMGMWVGRPDIIQVDKNSAYKVLSAGILVNISSEEYKEFKAKGALGIEFGPSIGFESVDIFVIEDGKYSSISSGTGFHFGAIFTHRIHNNLEMLYQFKYQGGGLNPSLSNASANFGRGILGVSLYGVSPMQGDYLRLKFGGGVAYNFGVNMEIDGKKVDNKIYTAKYKSTVGYRLGTIFETSVNRASYWLGLHFNIVSYEITEAKLNGAPFIFFEDKLNKPKGNGIEFTLGYQFLF